MCVPGSEGRADTRPPRSDGEDSGLASSIHRKRLGCPLGGDRVLYMLEFTRPSDWAEDWQGRTDTYTTRRLRCGTLRGKLLQLLPGWKVETIAFSLGTRPHRESAAPLPQLMLGATCFDGIRSAARGALLLASSQVGGPRLPGCEGSWQQLHLASRCLEASRRVSAAQRANSCKKMVTREPWQLHSGAAHSLRILLPRYAESYLLRKQSNLRTLETHNLELEFR